MVFPVMDDEPDITDVTWQGLGAVTDVAQAMAQSAVDKYTGDIFGGGGEAQTHGPWKGKVRPKDCPRLPWKGEMIDLTPLGYVLWKKIGKPNVKGGGIRALDMLSGGRKGKKWHDAAMSWATKHVPGFNPDTKTMDAREAAGGPGGDTTVTVGGKKEPLYKNPAVIVGGAGLALGLLAWQMKWIKF